MKIYDCQLIAAIWHQQMLNLAKNSLFFYTGDKKALRPNRRNWRETALTVCRIEQVKILERLPEENRISKSHFNKRVRNLIEDGQLRAPEGRKDCGSFYYIDNIAAYEAWVYTRNYWEGHGLTENPEHIEDFDQKLEELQKQLIAKFII